MHLNTKSFHPFPDRLRLRRLVLFAGLIIIAGLTGGCQKSGEESTPFKPIGTGERPTGTLPDANDLFLEAVRQGDTAKVRRELKSGEVEISARDGLGSSALLLAVRKTDQLPLVQLLYEADPSALDAADGRERTPLSWAAHFNRPALAEYLIDKGAQLDASDRAGNTPLAYAAMRNSLATAKLLLAKGAQVNHRNDLCDTPLMFAAAKGHVELTRLLARNGADPGYEDREGRTVNDRLQHLDEATRAQIQAILKTAPRSAMNPACDR